MNPVQLSIFANRLSGICDEMGAVLRLSALSPNIKDRLDFSCAIFDARGRLCAQAAHIPVHLGSMAYAMADLVSDRDWTSGDLLVVNDPYLGGTHLPDVTVVAPVFRCDQLVGFAVTRAHHANIGAHSPGSMPVSTHLEQEGLVIAPTLLKRAGQWQIPLCRRLAGLDEATDDLRLPVENIRFGDFAAQASACEAGARRLAELADAQPALEQAFDALNAYGEKRARARLAALPDGDYPFEDVMDDDGQGQQDITITLMLRIRGDSAQLDFAGTAAQVTGNINCPLSVAAAAAYYCFRCLMDDDVPACDGLFRPISLTAPQGCLLNACRPAAVAAGNVETSSRVVDVVLGALALAAPQAIPAASQGTMNNVAMGATGDQGWDYYETMAGGAGAHASGAGLSAVHTHMTNTLNTPIESLESHYPLRVLQYRIRRGSGGEGKHRGGDGIVRELAFLGRASFTLLTERRRHRPWGLQGGGAGLAGENHLNNQPLPPKYEGVARPGDRLRIASPGGGGYGGNE
ncbi:hydantoinase B/oxoprolinase family protein [Alcanivorax sp. DP30]|uniref:hydantoinase B/oxoprolinase family protein n=1 Tax=Alcanivorax sp. DP30 TaxID=2606217 RepID=UPI001368A844|nr:hydantoinase B/oxoprolinase family protein [Alcanivorax sp. DP30]MZR62318.1 hydantoinase B/oxoprolinase family protein [Alcanivorax sp. DP30]